MLLCLRYPTHQLGRGPAGGCLGRGLVLVRTSGGSHCPSLFPNRRGNIRARRQRLPAAHVGASQPPAMQSWSREEEQSKHALSRLFILCWGKGFFFFVLNMQ